MGPQGAKEIATVVRDNRTLLALNIGDNGITSEGLLAISSALKNNNTLQELDLRSNLIGNHGAAALAQALATNTWIKKLDFQHNSVKCQGAIALAATFKVMNAPTRMELMHFRSTIPWRRSTFGSTKSVTLVQQLLGLLWL